VLYSRNFDPPQQDNPPVRHRCRNPRCGAKLRLPVTNPRDAFCAAGCFTAFYRRRCLVCERAIIRGTERQRLCGRQKCKGEFRRHKERFFPTRYPPSGLSPNASRNPIKSALKTRSKAGRGFVQTAGPELSPIAFGLATLPLDPELVARLERAHRNYFEHRRRAKRLAARKAQIKRHHPPVNLLGGYRFPDAPEIDLSPLPEPSSWAVSSRWAPAPTATDTPDISDFLRRAQ
jgi:hypothetical protein